MKRRSFIESVISSAVALFGYETVFAADGKIKLHVFPFHGQRDHQRKATWVVMDLSRKEERPDDHLLARLIGDDGAELERVSYYRSGCCPGMKHCWKEEAFWPELYKDAKRKERQLT